MSFKDEILRFTQNDTEYANDTGDAKNDTKTNGGNDETEKRIYVN